MSRTFRLFISSTFSDLEAERNALHRQVFPELEKLCTSKGARFQAIDLRWGVSDEAGLDQRTMPLCLDEIARCQKADRPNFLILLGDRYGWRPLPATIPATEFEPILEKVGDAARDRLTTWYRRDDNAVPPEYYLRPRDPDGLFGTSGDPVIKKERSAAWDRMASAMRADLLGAIEGLDLSTNAETDAEARAKYVASATEQEIQHGAFRVPDAPDHVFCYLRHIEGLPGDASAQAYRDLLWPDGGGDPEPDGAAAQAQTRLKARLAEYLPDNVIRNTTRWKAGAPDLDLEAFCDDVKHRLTKAIKERLALDDDTDSASLEAEAHRRFAGHLAMFFTGRRDLLDRIQCHIEGEPRVPMVVRGVSGSGKSSLMAAAALAAAAVPGREIAMRFIGATAASTNGSGLLGGLCRQIGAAYGVTDPVPDDLQELTGVFATRLALATAERPLTVFIDAVDQLTAGDAGRRLTWLPAGVPEHVSIVVSTLPGDTFDAASSRTPEILEVDPMPEVEAAELLDAWLSGAGRTLQGAQRDEVLMAFSDAGGLPLYLKLAFEEARLWKSDGNHPTLAGGVPGLIRSNLFARLADPVNHGDLVVSRALGYLAASRFGLTEGELIGALSADEEVFRSIADQPYHDIPVGDAADQRIPVVVWARLYADLEPYLAERDADGATTLDFYHRQFREVSAATYLADSAAADRHSALAGLFRGACDHAGDATWVGDDIRGLSELPYHLIEAGRLDEAYDVLTDFRFMERKVAEVGIIEQADGTRLYTGVSRLREDYEHALAAMPDGDAPGDRHRIILTGVDLGDGLQIRCPHCSTAYPFQEEWRGGDIDCPGEECGGPLRINSFVVGEDPFQKWKQV